MVVLLVAWFLAVLPAIERMLPEVVVREEVKEEVVEKETVEEVAIELVPVEEEEKREEEKVEEEKRGVVAAKKQFVLPNGAVAERDPLRKNPAFISSQNMRAASTGEADPDGDPNRISQEGYDLPMLSLNAVDFKDGVEDSTSEMEARASETAEEAEPPDQVVERTPADVIADRPPEVQRPVAMPPVEAAGVARAEVREEERTNNPAAPMPERREEVKVAEVKERPPEVKVKELDAGDRPPGPKVKPKVAKPAALPVPKARDPLDLSGRPRVEEVRTKSRGGVTERGDQGSVDAEATPEGRYAKVIHERVGLVWNRKMSTIRGLTGVGTVEVEFEIDPEGRISGVQLVDPGKANPILEDVCLSAIMAAKLPPPPQELIEEMRDPLTGGKMRRRFTFHRL
jgi:hypothetical protein